MSANSHPATDIKAVNNGVELRTAALSKNTDPFRGRRRGR